MRIAIVGSGPAALMTADVVSGKGHAVQIFEKRKSAGRKLLVAGSSGLNITNSLPLEEFIGHYTGGSSDFWSRLIREFGPQQWIRFIEDLGVKTFEGTSGRYFIEEMKASRFLRSWCTRLSERGVEFCFDHECRGFETRGREIELRFSGDRTDERIEKFDAVCFCLGGGSWEPSEIPLRWPEIFKKHGLNFTEFTPSNVGYQVAWTEPFLKEAEGQPLKSVILTSKKGSRKGDAMITRYGMEGTPVYFSGEKGLIKIDLKPDLTVEQIVSRLEKTKENLSPIRRVKKLLKLCPAAYALLYHCTPRDTLDSADLKRLARWIKEFPLNLGDPQPLAEAISSAGGLALDEVDPAFMLKKCPGVFVAGEMLDWDVPTGGFLIQGCVAQGFRAGRGILEYLASHELHGA